MILIMKKSFIVLLKAVDNLRKTDRQPAEEQLTTCGRVIDNLRKGIFATVNKSISYKPFQKPYNILRIPKNY